MVVSKSASVRVSPFGRMGVERSFKAEAKAFTVQRSAFTVHRSPFSVAQPQRRSQIRGTGGTPMILSLGLSATHVAEPKVS
jgi:hypothetical protein